MTVLNRFNVSAEMYHVKIALCVMCMWCVCVFVCVAYLHVQNAFGSYVICVKYWFICKFASIYREDDSCDYTIEGNDSIIGLNWDK